MDETTSMLKLSRTIPRNLAELNAVLALTAPIKLGVAHINPAEAESYILKSKFFMVPGNDDYI